MILALGLFTLIPVPPFDVDRRTAAKAIAWLPWLGLLLGAAAGALAWLVGRFTTNGFLPAVVGLALLVAVTGAMHLDGLADTADGLSSRKPAEEALRIMRQSDIGPMGVVSLVLALFLDVAALVSVAPRASLALPVVLAVGAMVARMVLTLATVSADSARSQGFGALFIGVTQPLVAGATFVATLAVAGSAHFLIPSTKWWALPAAVLVATLVALGWTTHLKTRLGGMTGDTFGSIAEVTAATFYVASAILLGV